MNRPLAAAVALLLAPAGAFAANLLTNGGFESGDTGFASDYTVVVYGSNSMLNADPPLPRYTIGNSATFVHSSWTNPGPSEGTNMMIVNGGQNASADVWRVNLNVLAGQMYTVTGRFASLYSEAPAAVNFYVGSTAISASDLVVNQVGSWQTFSATFVADASSITLSLRDNTTAFTGNDFAVDALSVTPVPEPHEWAMMAAGLGVVGVMTRRRRAARAA